MCAAVTTQLVAHQGQCLDLQRPLLVAQAVLKRRDDSVLELSVARRKLSTQTQWFGPQHGANLSEESAVVPLLTQLAQHGVQTYKWRLGERSLAQALQRDLAANDEMVEQHRFLRGEVPKDGAAPDTCRVRDLIDRRLRVPLARKQLERGVGNTCSRRPSFAVANTR